MAILIKTPWNRFIICELLTLNSNYFLKWITDPKTKPQSKAIRKYLKQGNAFCIYSRSCAFFVTEAKREECNRSYLSLPPTGPNANFAVWYYEYPALKKVICAWNAQLTFMRCNAGVCSFFGGMQPLRATTKEQLLGSALSRARRLSNIAHR